MSDLVAGDFNYASVDADTAGKLECFARDGKRLIRKSQIQFIAEFGHVLSDARKLLSHKGDGTFVKWATAEFDLSSKTVFNYVNSWDKCLCNGYTNYLNWTPTALYLLVSDDTPKPVQKKLEKMGSSDLIRRCDVQRLIDASKPKPQEPYRDDSRAAETESFESLPENEWESGVTEVNQDDIPDVPFDAPEPSEMKPEKPPVSREEQAKLNRILAQQHIDKAVRAVDDLNQVKRNEKNRAAAVKLLQDAGRLLW